MTIITNYQCSYCQVKFTDWDKQENNYEMNISKGKGTNLKCSGEGELKIIHKSCLEIQKEKELAPYLFQKVEQLEKELTELKAKSN